MNRDRDAYFDIDVLKRILLRPLARTIDICDMYGQGRTAKEIADLMGMSESAVRAVIKRARRKLGAFRNGALSPRFDPELRGRSENVSKC